MQCWYGWLCGFCKPQPSTHPCFVDGCRLGAYLLLSALTCFALDVVTGPQQVARLPDPKQLQEVRAAAERRKSMANLQLRRAAERAMRKNSSVGESTSRSLAYFCSQKIRSKLLLS